MRKCLIVDIIPTDRVSITFLKILSFSSESFVMMSDNTIKMHFAGFVNPDVKTFCSFANLNWRGIATFFNHDYQMLVQREWFALVILPSANILSQTLTKTWNFCSRVSVSAPSHFFITLSICALDLIITNDGKFVQLLLQIRKKIIHQRYRNEP